MILPVDDSVTLPANDDGPLVVDKTNPASATLADLLSLLPGRFRGGSSLCRDTLLQTWGEMANTIWSRASFVLGAQQSPRLAEGNWLDAWGQVQQKPRIAAEPDPDYRARLMTPFDVVTPNAIKPVVVAIGAKYTPNPLWFIEPVVDAPYCGPATTSDATVRFSNNDATSSTYATQTVHGALPAWQCFTQPVAGQGTANQTVYANQTKRLLSYYPDRATPLQPSYVVPNAQGGLFWVVLPSDSNDDSQTPHCNPLVSPNGFFYDAAVDYIAPATTTDTVVKNSNNDASSSTYGTQSVHGVVPAWNPGFCSPTANTALEQIRSEVDQRKAGGVAWMAFVDNLLGNAL